MFKLVDAYLGLRLDADLSTAPQDHVIVVESPRRLAAEPSYGYAHALWWLRLADGRSVISTPPGTGAAVSRLVSAMRSEEAMACPEIAAALRAAVSAVVSDYVRQGGEAVYSCDPTNSASIATARSVDFVSYAQSMVLAAPS